MVSSAALRLSARRVAARRVAAGGSPCESTGAPDRVIGGIASSRSLRILQLKYVVTSADYNKAKKKEIRQISEAHKFDKGASRLLDRAEDPLTGYDPSILETGNRCLSLRR